MRRIVMADPDLNYILKLQAKFFQKLQDSYDIEVITDEDIIDRFFKQPQSASCLIINKAWAASGLSKHNIENVFILTEGKPENSSEISRFSSIDEIYNRIRNAIGTDTKALTKEDATVILFKSASGGTGKTVLSLALAEYLARKYYRVLYLNTQSLQMFHYYLENKSSIASETAMSLQFNEKIYEKLSKQIMKESFDYLPPFSMPLYAYNIDKSMYLQFIREAKASKSYDYIIVDSDNNMDANTVEQITLADKVFMITVPGEEGKFALSQMLKKLSIGDKLIRICNRVTEGDLIAADETISEWKTITGKSIHEFAETNSIKKLAVLVS